MAKAAKLSPTTEMDPDSARLCTCGNKISSKDTHQVCSECLGLEHARAALDYPGSCGHCARFTAKSLRRRLARQVSLSGRDPALNDPATTADQLGAVDPATAAHQLGATEPATAAHQLGAAEPATVAHQRGAAAQPDPGPSAWGSVLDLQHSLEDELVLDYEDEGSFGDEYLVSEDDEDDSSFVPPGQVASSPLTTQARDSSEAAQPQLSSDLHDVCQRAAERLDIPWPPVVAEAPRSRYEGKKLPQAKRAARQLLPVFPELLDEVSVSWKDRPFSSKNPIFGASSLDFLEMERLGMARMPPMEPMVAAHLHPKLSATSTRSPAHPSKSDRFQSTLTERAYKAAALSVRALNVTSMLTAYQAELCEDMSDVPNPAIWDDITTVSDICLRVQRCAVQAVGKCMAMLVLQERARWLNLTNLSDKEREDILDMPVVPEGIFGSALASMQQRCEAKKRDDEALQLCLPRKVPATQTAPKANSAQVGPSRPVFNPSFRIPRRPRPQAAAASAPGPQVVRPTWPKKPTGLAVPPRTAPQPQGASQPPRRRKKAS